MATNPSANITDPSNVDPNSNLPAHGANPASHGEQDTPEELKRKLALLEAKNAELVNDNAKYRRKQNEQEQAAQLALEKQLKEQGEFKQLFEQQQQRVQELEPVAKRYHDLSMQVAHQVEAQIKDWPDEIKTFDPGNDAPIEERLTWIEKSKPLVERLQQQSRQPGNGPNPTPGSPTKDDLQNQYTKRLRQSGRYVV